MAEFIRKIIFDYTKKDGETSLRSIMAPKFLKESYNIFQEFEKEQVGYVSGYEVQREGMSEEDIKEYEEVLVDYFTIAIPSIEEYFKDLGLDPTKIKQKTFSKKDISNPSVIKD